MNLIKRAGAWCNGEVAYLAWDVEKPIKGCVGFMVTRVHETGRDAGKRRILPTWIAFTDQNNPNWNEQDSSVWPIQNFHWRDLTLRKSRDTTKVRPIDFRVHYEIVPVALADASQKQVPISPTAPAKDAFGQPSYLGPKHPLVAIGSPIKTNAINVTHTYGKNVKATFTNGILSTQNLVRQLESVKKGPPKNSIKDANSDKPAGRAKAAGQKETHLLKTLKEEIRRPDSKIREFLMGDVYKFVTELVDRARKEGGQVYLALYELHDTQLIKLLVDAMKSKLIHVILTTAGNLNPNPKGAAKKGAKKGVSKKKAAKANKLPVLWDTENDEPRAQLHKAAGKDKGRMIDRMFNSSTRIGHNKLAVYVKGDKPIAVMTGSTNWTETGLCAQSNNCIIVEDDAVAADYFAYWNALKNDELAAPREGVTVTVRGKKVQGAEPNSNKQGAKIRAENQKSRQAHKLSSSGTAKAWFAPNTKQPTVPKKNPGRPADLKEVYDRMDAAKKAIYFLVFMPGRSGVNNIIGKGAAIEGAGNNDDAAAAIASASAGDDGESARFAKRLTSIAKDRFVLGAISDPTAMPNYKAPKKGEKRSPAKKRAIKMPPPAIWWPGGPGTQVAMVRAAAVRIPFGNLRPELLTAGHAIIHDKIVVIDPLDKKNCTVITGSHNLGYKASYCNDENFLIIEGNRDLAVSYAVHVLDLYEHYLMRARLEEKIRQDIQDGKLTSYEEAAAQVVPHGLLSLTDTWQKGKLESKGPSSLSYFLANA
ncbi:phosphatidylserine/phosphatidylglycerophosphate/cardiolipin synthase-like enzyme [Bradyrhizobium sp. JR4.1]|uniref:phospholipase D-like domain-containing protein n=1 Tax=Bradyrhizobium sp. JR4.1 TaxID=3156372 RepID=UPI00339573F8